MRLWRESAAYKREEEAERDGELIGARYAQDRGPMTPERRAYPLELFRLEVVRGDYFRRDGLSSHCCAPASAGFFYLSASSSASRSSAGLTRPLCLKTSAPERS